MRSTRIGCIVIAALALAQGTSAQSSAPGERNWKRIESPLAVEWPRDHGAHPEYQTEWWYATGEVADTNGESFGFQLTIFRRGLDARAPAPGESSLHPYQVLAAHLALVDIGARDFRSAERVRREGAGLAQAREGMLDAWLEDWEIARADEDAVHLTAFDREHAIGIDLVLTPKKRLVMHGARGISHKGPEDGDACAYMSWTRLAAQGSLRFGERECTVIGEAWFDHEWGTSELGLDVVGWDWFGLRFNDGRELMIYRLRRKDGSASTQSAGTLVDRDGTAHALSATDFTLESLATWKSPRSGALYPARFRLTVPSRSIDIEVRPRVDDCEIDARRSTGTTYWEGPVAVDGSIEGEGYGELTGYASSLARRL